MASSSSLTTPSSKHDVFLSFRGTDTRNSVTSHLYDALKRNHIDAYIDNKLDGGEKIEPALLERIEESCISLVIFSEKYADSTFCLRELSKILECKETKGQMVLPVFYRLDPSHVQNLTGSYGDALCRHERDCCSQEVESWRHASKEIANLKGWDSNVIKDETKLIQEIVSDIQKKLNHAPSPSIDAERLVGMESRVEDIESLLSFGSTGTVLIVGIWGMCGIGKSTTAEAVYHRNRSKFEGHCFFQNVREESQKHGVDQVRQEILGMVLGKNDLKICGKVLPSAIKRMLQRKKVLIVFDDVDDARDLKYLLGEDGLFGQGSRIIVTSRDRQVLINACDEDKIYQVKILVKEDALRLFSLHAFKQNNPIEGYIGLSKTVVSCVQGIPLVLEVLGASLYKKTSLEYWESKVAQLRTTGGEDIKKCLEMCYHELDQTEKKIFLDIACFFGRCKRDLLQQTLDLEESSGIDRLADMCLIKIVQDKIWMHDVLLILGQEIVLRENVDPRERSRLWRAEDVCRVLTTQGTTGSKVESISLILDATKELRLSPTAFEGMYNLRLLKIYYPPFLKDPSKEKIMIRTRIGIHLPRGLHFLSSELRFLYWYNYPLKSLPSNFFPEKLVQLEMPCSQLEQLWNEGQRLENLQLMNPPSSSKPSLIHSVLSKVLNHKFRLTTLELSTFESLPGLASLPNCIGELKSLTKLNLNGCSRLASLPYSIGELKSLTKLNLNGCSRLANLPDNIGELKSLDRLYLKDCSGLATLPDSIGELKSLDRLYLKDCSGLATLPDNIGELKSLDRLYLKDCSGLATLPDSVGELKSLDSLYLGGCSGLATLPESIGELKSLDSLYLRGCSGLASLPNSIGELKSLDSLYLGGCSGLASLPDSIGELKSLVSLYLDGCLGLATLPDSIGELKSLNELSLDGCSGLATLSDNIGELKSLNHFTLKDCSGLASLPDNIGELKSLDHLDLKGCSGLASLPNRIDELKSLKSLHLRGCSGLASLPDRIDELKSLKSLHLNGCSGLATLPDSIGELKSLIWLDLSSCLGLESLPDSICELKSLSYLYLQGCSRLATLPNKIGELKSLDKLCLEGCSGLASLPNNICSGLASLPNNIIYLEFRGLDKQCCYMLSGFQKVEEIALSTNKLGCHEFLNLGNSRVLKTPESLGSLVSLTQLTLSKIDFERIPASIKHLTSLHNLYLDDCKWLQCLPELPLTLQVLIASGCISLKSVASIFMQGDREYKAASQEFNFSECLQLDQNSRTRIMGAARLRIQRMATSLFSLEYHGKPLKEVRLCIPGSEVPEWFSYKNREGSSVKIWQPAQWHRGFTFCAVVSFGQNEERRPVNIKCECHLISKDGTQIDLSSYYYELYEEKVRSLWEREHVFIWSVHSKCFFKEASFQFKSPWGASDVVVGCGVHPLLVNEPEQPNPKTDGKFLTYSSSSSI